MMEAAHDENASQAPFHNLSEADCTTKTRRQLEQELNVQILPGTEVMVDNGKGNHRFVKSSASSGRVLVPQPSDDPHDPLVYLKPSNAAIVDIVADAVCGGELEQLLEILGLDLCYRGHFHASPGASRDSAYVPRSDQRF